MNKKILFIAPHPDDETLGCGGTILKHKADGDAVFWLIMTAMKPEDGWAADSIARREEEIRLVSGRYGFDKVFSLGFPAARLDTVPLNQIVAGLSGVLCEAMPEVVYVPFWNDVHSDHRITFHAATAALKTFRAPYVKKVLAYETLSETEFSQGDAPLFAPNVFCDITPFFERKKAIFGLYGSEVMEPPLPRSFIAIESLARFRGARAGKDFCEAFILVLEIL